MYGLILMTAMTTAAPEAPSGIFFNRGPGCCGCTGACYGCSGCYGACYGCSGCYGACRGCYGASCYGCSGCYGYATYSSCYGCYGCCGCYGGAWGAAYTYSATVPFGPPTYIPSKVPENTPPPKKLDGKDGKAPDGAARLIIEVPQNAKLYIDNQPMKSTSTERFFYTPALQPGQKYYYDVRVEVVKEDGQKVSDKKQIIVQAGDVIRQSFRTLGEPAVASAGR